MSELSDKLDELQADVATAVLALAWEFVDAMLRIRQEGEAVKLALLEAAHNEATVAESDTPAAQSGVAWRKRKGGME